MADTRLKWTYEKLEELHNLNMNGMSKAAIGRMHGIGGQRVAILLNKFHRVVASRWRRFEFQADAAMASKTTGE